MPRIIQALVPVALLILASTASAQSLADIARREAERRTAIQAPGKLYTNEHLQDTPAPPPSSGPVRSGGDQRPADLGESSATAAPAPRTEAEWRQGLAAARDALARAQRDADTLQIRIGGLAADVIPADRQKLLAELDRAKQDARRAREVLDNLLEDAASRDVPADWVR